MNTIEFLKHRRELRKNRKHGKESLTRNTPPPPPPGVNVTTIAIVLDGEVQEVVRAEDRLTALLLSEPSFQVVEPSLDPQPTIGWKWDAGVFTPPQAASDEA